MQRSIVEEFARGVIRTFELPKGRSRSQYHHDADFTDRKELITTKRMERRSPGGRLISVTDMRTRHFDDTRPRQYSPPPPIREERRSRYDDFYAQREFSSSYYSPDSVSYEERRYSPRKRVEINRPISVERQQRYSDNFDPLTIHDSTSTPYDDWRRTDSVVKQSTIVKNPHLYEENPESPYVTSMNALVARINYLRRSAGRRELLHSPKLARIAGEWAERIARTGQMRLDEEYPMNVWMGPVVTPSIADTWWQESEIYSSSNYFKQDDLLHIAAAKTFCDRKSAYVVVAVSADIGWQSAIGSIANTGYGNCQQWTQLPDGRTCCLVNYNGQNQWQCFNNQQQDMGNGQYNNYWQQYCQSYPYIQGYQNNGGYANQQYWYIYCSRYPYSPCCPSHLKVWADIAVVYELKEPLDHMTKVITSIIRDDLFNYPGNPYAMGFDLNGLRASKVAPIPYPGAYYYVGVPAVYGEPLSNDDFVDILGSYSSSYPPDNDTMSIDNGLSYVLYNLNQSRNAAGSFLPRVVILVANNDSTVDGAKRTAQLLRNTNTLIITVSVDSDGDFSSLATGPNYVFEIRNVTDDIPVVQQIGNILVSMSSICFHDNGPPPKSSSTVTTQQAKTTTQQAKTTSQQAETTSQATTASSMPSTTKLSNKFGKSMFPITIAVLLIIFCR